MEYGLVGHPLGHSFSQEIHEAIGGYAYEIKDLDQNDFIQFMKEKKFRGINVTIPYKEKVTEYLDFIDPVAQEIGAVNTVININNKLYGYNTDIFGITDLIKRNIRNLQNKTALILGSGGTSKTAEFALKKLGCKKIYKASRKKRTENTENVTRYVTYDDLPFISEEISLIINTTPVGMYPKSETSPIDLDGFKKTEAVIDAVYNPIKTKLVYKAESLGIKSESGLYMLVSQAVKASELFSDTKIKNDLKEKIFNRVLKTRQNIVLTGMPGSGKTTLGKKVATITNKPFIDTDEIIENNYGHPSEIIKNYGEKRFRDIETEAIKSIMLNTGTVIAVGGGAILKDENIEYLKRNGVLIFIDRDISEISPTDDRPLSSDKEKLEKIYKERYDRYIKTADIKIKAVDNIEKNVKKITEEFFK